MKLRRRPPQFSGISSISARLKFLEPFRLALFKNGLTTNLPNIYVLLKRCLSMKLLSSHRFFLPLLFYLLSWEKIGIFYKVWNSALKTSLFFLLTKLIFITSVKQCSLAHCFKTNIFLIFRKRKEKKKLLLFFTFIRCS